MNQNPARVIALKLHALHEEDRAWVLSRLDSTVQSRLAPLLEELKDIGLELEPDIIDSFESIQVTVNAAPQDVTVWLNTESATTIDSASVSQIALAFEQEPTIFLQCLCVMHSWKWVQEFEGKYPNLCQLTTSNMRTGFALPPTPAVKNALVNALAQQIIDEKNLTDQLSEEISSRYFLMKKKPVFQLFLDKISSWNL